MAEAGGQGWRTPTKILRRITTCLLRFSDLALTLVGQSITSKYVAPRIQIDIEVSDVHTISAIQNMCLRHDTRI